jgi:rare lipoprotein A (peptidoglycan hydrolase)
VAAVLCGGLFGAPLLLLQNSSSGLSLAAASTSKHHDGTSGVRPASDLDHVQLPSHLVAYDAPSTTTTVPPSTTTTTAPPVTTTSEAPIATTTTTAEPAPTALAAASSSSPQYSENGVATWYAAAPDGYCASPTLPFGTVLTVVDDANENTTTCIVDDREESPYPRVVDLSPEGFAQLAPTSQGVVDVTISW